MLIATAMALWTLLSGLVLVRIGFFRGGPLAAAPRRESQLTIGFLLAVVVLYLGAEALGAQAGQFVGQAMKLGPPAASQPAATAPNTRPAATATSTSAPAPGLALGSIWAQAGASAARILLAIFLLLPLGRVVTGGLSGFGLDPRRIVRGVGLGVIAAMMLVPWYCWVSLATESVSHYLRNGRAPVHPVLQALRENRVPLEQGVLIATAVLSAPLIEEMLFRGLLQTYLLRFGRRRSAAEIPQVTQDSRTDSTTVAEGPIPLDYFRSVPKVAMVSPAWRWLCILVVSVLFAAIHIPIMGPEAFPPLMVLAVTLGYMYERTGNLWACMTLHALFNLTGIAVNYL